MENKAKMRLGHYISLALGEAGYTIQTSFVASYMVLYFTTSIGINALTVGTMTLVCRIIDAFTDVGFGIIADRTKKNRFGKFKPWYAGSLIPTAVAFVLLFAVPNSIGAASAAAVLFMYFIYILYGSIFATVNYQWLSAQNTVCTDDPKEKRLMASWRHWAAAVSGIVISYIGINLILKFGNGDITARSGYMWTALIIAGLCFVLMVISCIFSKERHTLAEWEKDSVTPDNPAKKLSLKDEFRTFKGNKLLWGALLINLFTFMLATCATTLTSYYYSYYVGQPAMIATVMTTATIVGAIANTILVPVLTPRLSRNTIYFISMAGMLVCWIMTWFSMGNILVLTIGQCIFQSFIQLFNNIIFRTMPDAVDWGEWKYGYSAPGIITSFISFVQKIGMGVATFIVTLALTIVGYQEGVAQQTEAAAKGISTVYPILPIIFILLTLIGFFLINSVKKDELIQMRKDLDAKRGREFDEKNAIV